MIHVNGTVFTSSDGRPLRNRLLKSRKIRKQMPKEDKAKMDDFDDSTDYMRYVLIPIIILQVLDNVSEGNKLLIFLRALQLIIV